MIVLRFALFLFSWYCVCATIPVWFFVWLINGFNPFKFLIEKYASE